ncbi:Putative lectin-like protein [Komagataella phaffii CBS 7435]|uniref:Putative lectin-like protein n=1 Tax=Komagataella phaffii (strain ATCC 76273 / CBS 7435 / CECT 11047 / NRRL Y-11430 / Wegner 21-1) TaxID=981350 RepID=F2QXN8_KOMPC|nr:Putative lectin-like protein [Komagataella phaffii CBS 7435]CCA40166.1 Putative lectin-like protein [Komagataella phaffii CBS 7435]
MQQGHDVIPTPLPTSGVDIDTIPYDAFNVAVYHYPADNYELANNLGFLTSGYEGLGQVTTATSVGNINFDTSSGWPYYIESNALGNTGSYVNATIEYVGFFQAPANGNYELSFSNIDYNAILFLGSPATDSSLAKREVQFLKPETSSEYVLFFDHGKDAGQTVSTTQYLSAGLYYPLRIVLAAVSERAQLDFQITLPDGRVLDQYQGYVYNFAHEGIESATSSAHETSWSRFTNSTIYSHSSTIGIITSSTDAPHSVINPTAIETTSTDTSISTVAVTTSICDTKDCVKTTVITPNSPLPTQTVSLTTTTIDRSEVVQTAHSAVPSQFAPDAHPSAVTITREQCDAYSCSQATIVSGKVLQTTTVSDSTTVVPLDTPQLSVEASTLETRLKSTQSSRAPTVTVQTSQSSRHSEDVTESSVHVSEFDAQSTSATSASALQAPSSISLQTGGANTLRLSAFLGTALLPMLNVLFI